VIRCNFSTASLYDPPDFEALSYVWSNPQGVSWIRLEDHDFLVTENLHCALMNMREDNRERILWIDALLYQSGGQW